MSTTGSLEYVRLAKRMGLRVTCEVTPHHFTLLDEDVRYDTNYKMNPPLASRDDRDALIAGLADGSVDAIATDHAPHHPASKDVEFDRAPFGIIGFETALALALSELVHPGKTFARCAWSSFSPPGPPRVLGIERKIAAGEPADLTIFSTDHPVDLSRRRFTQQIAQHSIRRPHLPRRTHGHNRRRPHRLSPRAKRQRLLSRERAPLPFVVHHTLSPGETYPTEVAGV